MVNIDRTIIKGIIQTLVDEVKDIPNDGNNQVLKRLLLGSTRMYEMKKQYADGLVGEAEHSTIVDDLSSMVEHINAYRSLLGLSLM